MFCKYCGNKLDVESTFCAKCGKKVSVEEATEYFEEEKLEQVKKSIDPAEEKEKSEFGEIILRKAITALVCSAAALTFLIIFPATTIINLIAGVVVFAIAIASGILGLVFATNAKNLANEFAERFGGTCGKATVGKILTIPGKILAILSLAVIAYIAFFSFFVIALSTM